MFHISIFLELTHTLHRRILFHLTKLYSVQDYGLSHLPRAESISERESWILETSHHSKESNLTGPQGRPIKPSSQIHQKGDHNLDFTGWNGTKRQANKAILRIFIKTDRIARQGRNNVFLVDVATFKGRKKIILRHANVITCNIKICSRY